jgi:hypothetical protein
MKQLFISIILILFLGIAKSQVPTVIFQQEIQGFDGGISLPSEKNFIISGNVPELINKVEVKIYTNNRMDKLFYSAGWSRNVTDQNTTFAVPVNQFLRSNENYTIVLDFYTRVERQEQVQKVESLQNILSEYINAQTRINRKNLIFNKPPEALLNDMNAIVLEAFKNYDVESFTFSDIIIDKIKQIEYLKIKTKQEDINTVNALAELKKLLNSEIVIFLPREINKLAYQTIIKDYPSQKLPNVLGINLGYGATFFDKTNIGYAPYAGLSIPLGNLAFAPFMSGISFSTGFFLSDVKDENSILFTGPVINKPLYIGLGYRLYDFVRLTAGAVILENNTLSSTNNIDIKPYVGICIDLNLWIGLGKQRPYSNN